jgi:hypothetical protein
MRFAVIGLGQRIAAVLSALKTAGAEFELDGYFDPELSRSGLSACKPREFRPAKPIAAPNSY